MRAYAIRYDAVPEAERAARRYAPARAFMIRHSGCSFTSDILTDTKYGPTYVWPIEELLARETFPPALAQRIRKLNPYGKPEGEGCAGFWMRPPWP